MAEVINQFWVGIDVAKAKFDAAVFPDGMQPERWRQLETKSFASDKKGVAAFVRWIQTLGGCCAGMCAESTGIYSADLAEALHEKAPDLPLLAIVNPARVKATAKTFGTKDKSDSVDARVIAAFAAWHRPKPTPLRSPEWQNLRSLFLARESLLADAVAYEQRAQVSRDKDCIASHRRTAKRLYAEAEFFDKKIEAAIANEPTFAKHDKLLRSIPGIGPVISCAILALFGDLTKWTRGEATSAAGLFPRKCESGTSVRGKPCMSKGGGRPPSKEALHGRHPIAHERPWVQPIRAPTTRTKQTQDGLPRRRHEEAPPRRESRPRQRQTLRRKPRRTSLTKRPNPN
jgi:transposase